MRTIFRRRGQGLVLAALALIVGLPERAQAQQTGLFPLAPIRRQRVPCDQQDPTYKIHKYQYFGYHPTCWQPFPAGWGCPSPEAPNKAEAFRKQPFDAGTGLNEPGPGNMGPMPGEPDLTRPEVPPIPGGRPSPFETQPGAGRPGNVPAPPGGDTVVPSPFDLEKKDAAPGATPNAPRAGQERPAAPSAGADPPELTAPTAASDRVTRERNVRADANQEVGTRDEDGPLLALPSITVPPVDDSGSVFGAQPAQPAATTADSGPNPAATSPAPRRGFLSGLFNNLGWNWTRR